MILAARCPSLPFFMFRHVWWDDIKTYFQHSLALVLPKKKKRKEENNMQISKVSQHIKDAKTDMGMLLGWQFCVVELEVCTCGKLQERID